MRSTRSLSLEEEAIKSDNVYSQIYIVLRKKQRQDKKLGIVSDKSCLQEVEMGLIV